MKDRMKVMIAYDASPHADEAREWAADSIFVGSHGLHYLEEGAGSGSVSAASMTNAACSVRGRAFVITHAGKWRALR